MNPLVDVIDDALTFVRTHPDVMTRDEVEHFKELAERVWSLTPGNWLLRLPRVPELRPELEPQNPLLPPAQFISKLNLPGDWEPVTVEVELRSSYALFGTEEPPTVPDPMFLVCATPRWFSDMDVLRRLVLQSESTTSEVAAKSSGADAEGEQRPPLTHEDAAILKVLLQASVTMTVDKIEAKVTLSDKTIRTRVKKLRALGLVYEPEKKKGYTTTAKGIGVAKSLSADAGVEFMRAGR